MGTEFDMKIDIDTVVLSHGAHNAPDEGMCLLECVALFSGEKFSDEPLCVDPVLAAFGRSWNDGMRSDKEREQLKQYITRLPGTQKSNSLSQKRAWMAIDWLIRIHTVAWLSISPSLVQHAEILKSLPEITCIRDLTSVKPKIDAAWDAAGNAAGIADRATAWIASLATAGDAARTASWATARDAARDDSWDVDGAAAGAASWYVARDAAVVAAAEAGAAAKSKLEPTVIFLQASAHELFSAMINATEDSE